jgi:spore coat polysaccharide biosynthesis predicted glycosyltransferase SpsG
MEAVFVVEGGPEAGLGHIYHTTTIAGLLGPDWDVRFLTSSDQSVRETIGSRGFDCLDAPREEFPAVISDRDPAVVVIDVPRIEMAELRDIRTTQGFTGRLVVFGNRNIDLPPESASVCDVLVDFNIGRGANTPQSGRHYDEETDTLELVGLQYFVLRDTFYEHAGVTGSGDDLGRVLLLFGGSDPSNLSSRVLERLLTADRRYDVSVVLGPGFSHDEAFEAVLSAHDTTRVTVERNVDDVASRMLESDIVVTSPGLTLLESLVLGVPVFAVYQNDLQEVYSGYDFVVGESSLPDIERHLVGVYRSFDRLTDDLKIDFEAGRAAVLDAIRGEYET